MRKMITKSAASELRKATQKAAKENTNLPSDFGTREYTCMKCNDSTITPEAKFYLSRFSRLWENNDRRFPICKACLNELFQENLSRYGTRMAYLIMCYILDVPFYNAYVDSIEKDANLSIATYLKKLGKSSPYQKTFANSLMDGEVLAAIRQSNEEQDVSWSASDIKNKKYVVSMYGYEPFTDEEYNEADQRLLYNMLAGYMADEEDADAHKRISAITMVKTILQRERIDRLINAELQSPVPSANLKSYTDAKRSFEKIISDTANENGFSAKSTGRSSKKATTLTSIMKQMLDDGFEPAKANVVDAKMNGVYYEMSKISNQNIMDQLNFQNDDYARMCATQRDLLQKYDEARVRLEEENRKLRILVKELGAETRLDDL